MIGVGWLTSILTVAETTWTVTTVTMAIFIQQLAIVLAVIVIGGTTTVVKRKWWDKRCTGSGDDDYHSGGEGQRIHESTGGDYVGSGGGTYHAKEYQKGFAIATPVV